MNNELLKIGPQYAYDGRNSGNESIIKLKIVSTMAGTCNIQMFNTIQAQWLLGASGGVFAAEVFTPFNGFTAEDIVASTDNTIMFNSAGDLVYTNAAGATVTISLEESNLSYRDFVNAIAFGKFDVKRMKMTSVAESQLKQGIFTITKYSDLGESKQQQYPIVSAFSAFQNQNTLLEIPLQLELTKNLAVGLNVLTNETVNLQLIIA